LSPVPEFDGSTFVDAGMQDQSGVSESLQKLQMVVTDWSELLTGASLTWNGSVFYSQILFESRSGSVARNYLRANAGNPSLAPELLPAGSNSFAAFGPGTQVYAMIPISDTACIVRFGNGAPTGLQLCMFPDTGSALAYNVNALTAAQRAGTVFVIPTPTYRLVCFCNFDTPGFIGSAMLLTVIDNTGSPGITIHSVTPLEITGPVLLLDPADIESIALVSPERFMADTGGTAYFSVTGYVAGTGLVVQVLKVNLAISEDASTLMATTNVVLQPAFSGAVEDFTDGIATFTGFSVNGDVTVNVTGFVAPGFTPLVNEVLVQVAPLVSA
jgi:hypothetical protein